jgi:ABC-type transporter Mla MlaB component
MALQITNKDGIYEIKGNLNSQNVFSLNNHFEALLKDSKFIALSLNKLINIDSAAVATIVGLHQKAIDSNKLFYIIGKENPIVNGQFQKGNWNSVLRSSSFLSY